MEKEIEKEIKRCEELFVFYEEIPEGFFGASMIKQSIRDAKMAIEKHDTGDMKKVLANLKGIEG